GEPGPAGEAVSHLPSPADRLPQCPLLDLPGLRAQRTDSLVGGGAAGGALPVGLLPPPAGGGGDHGRGLPPAVSNRVSRRRSPRRHAAEPGGKLLPGAAVLRPGACRRLPPGKLAGAAARAASG